MYLNDALLKYCEFYTGHKVESIQIFIKTTWSITSCQSESGNKTWTSIVLNFFVNYSAQSCVGSRQRNDVTRSIFCPKFCKLVIDAILPRKEPVTRAMSKRLQEDWARAVEEGPRVLMNLRVDFSAHGPRLGPIIFVHNRQGCHYIWSLYLGLHIIGRVP